MSKIITYQNPDISKEETTTLSSAISPTDTTLNVVSSADFNVNDYIVIDVVGSDICELRQIATIPNSTTITITEGVNFTHGVMTKITKSLFNQMRLYRSADNITYTLIDTKPIDYQDPYNRVEFIDNMGNDNYYYKVEYWNSTTSIGVMSSPIKTLTQIGYINIEDFKKETGIKIVEDDIISHAIKFGAQQIIRKIYSKRSYQTTLKGTRFEIPVHDLEFADSDLDDQITKHDFLIYERSPDGIRTYVNNDVNDIDVDRHIIFFNNEHPTKDNTLVFEFYLTYRKLNELDEILRRLNLLYAVNYIFRNIPFKRLQRGIGSWTINGVSVSFESGMMNDIVKQNEEEIKNLINSLTKLSTRFTAVRKQQPIPISFIKSTLNWS